MPEFEKSVPAPFVRDDRMKNTVRRGQLGTGSGNKRTRFIHSGTDEPGSSISLYLKALAGLGSMFGSAGVVMLNDTVDMRWAAAWPLRFFQVRSCGLGKAGRLPLTSALKFFSRRLPRRCPEGLAPANLYRGGVSLTTYSTSPPPLAYLGLEP